MLSNDSNEGRMRPLLPAYVLPYFGAADFPWLRALIAQRRAFANKPRAEWKVRTRFPIHGTQLSGRNKVALEVLEMRAKESNRRSLFRPAEIRQRLCEARAQDHDADLALARVGSELGIAAKELRNLFLSDLGDARLLPAIDQHIDLHELTLAINTRLVQKMLRRAIWLQIEAIGDMRKLVTQARWTGLICTVNAESDADRLPTLTISGPLALFNASPIYARSMSALLARLTWCSSFRATARLVRAKDGAPYEAHFGSGEPLLPASESALYDSKVEADFARSFAQRASEWHLEREASPLKVTGGLIYPDFLARHRWSGRACWLEIVGYWRKDYLHKKVEDLRAMALTGHKLIACVDTRLSIADELENQGVTVLRYKRAIDVNALFDLLARL
jgi:predicted nuclease of restriction endonuclease-like RecB superfamily